MTAPRGARRPALVRAFLPLVALALLAAVAPRAARAGAERLEGPPPWRTGGSIGFTVDAVARPDSGRQVLEVGIRIPPGTLARLARDESGRAVVQADVRVRGRYGARTQDASQTFDLAPRDSSRGLGRVIVMRFPAAPGPCRVDVKLTDMLSHRASLLSGRNAHEDAEVSGEYEIPKPQNGRVLSHLDFLWPHPDSTAGSVFEHGGEVRIPNPDRLYGLFADRMQAAFSASARPGDTRPWHWVARVFAADGQGVAQRESTLVAGAPLDGEVTFDLSSEPAGGYDLELKAWQEGDPTALTRRERFSVAWQADSWLHSAAQMNDEAHFLLQAGAEEDFVRMQPGEQEALLDEFWRMRDPTPDTAYNEALETFRARVRHANATYTRAGIERGMFSDMGRTYIRYGEPSEILRQVIPAGESTLETQLQQILNDEDRQPLDVQQKGLGGDMRPFEVWIYEGDIPLPPDADPREDQRGRSKRRLLFLFVDEQGIGLYRLRYSTE